MTLRIGTRGSELALAQSRFVQALLAGQGYPAELVIVHTEGDRNTDVPFAQVGSAGIFVRALEAALEEGRVDLAVHSYKDLPSESPGTLHVAAVPERESPEDVLLCRQESFAGGEPDLPLRRGAWVGTASARRTSLLRAVRPDLRIGLLRGNVPTRLRKLQQRAFDAILLAQAGVQRLKRSAEGAEPVDARVQELLEGLHPFVLDPAVFVPAPTQGALACQVRRDRTDLLPALEAIHRPELDASLAAEREFLRLADGGCELPLGAWCRPSERARTLAMDVFVEQQGRPRRARGEGDDPLVLARRLWQEVSSAEKLG